MSSGTNGQTKALRIALASAVGSKEILRRMKMNRRTTKISVLAAAVLALCLPALAAAQGGYSYPDYSRDRDYGRNGDYRNDRNRTYDDYGQYGRYDDRYLRDSIRRLDRLSRDFDRDLDRELDHSNENGSRHEDHLNADAKEFRRAVIDLKTHSMDAIWTVALTRPIGYSMRRVTWKMKRAITSTTIGWLPSGHRLVRS